MISQALNNLLSIHNPMHKPPTYDEMGITKPQRQGRNNNTQSPTRLILCAKCKKPGGTLLRADNKGKREYRHAGCFQK